MHVDTMDQSIFDLIADIQRAAMDQALWQSVLKKVAAMTHSRSAAICVHEGDAVVLTLSSEQPSSRPDTLGEAVSVNLALSHARTARFSIQRPAQNATLSPRDGELFDILQKHIHQSLIVQDQLGKQQSTIGLLKEAMNKSPKGIVVVEGEGDVVHANTRAETIIGMNDGVSISHGRLRFATHCAQQEFEKLLAETKLADFENSDMAGSVFKVPRPSSEPEFEVTVSAFTGGGGGCNRKGRAFVIIYDPTKIPSLSPQLLASLYGLSNSQARVAALLVRGHKIKDIAKTLSLTENTTRYYTKEIFSKTGTQNQADLVKLVYVGPITPSWGDGAEGMSR